MTILFIKNYYLTASLLSLYSDYAMGWATGVPYLAGAGIFSPRYRVQTGSGAHPAYFPVVTENKAIGA
jgi:hypothetical protein